MYAKRATMSEDDRECRELSELSRVSLSSLSLEKLETVESVESKRKVAASDENPFRRIGPGKQENNLWTPWQTKYVKKAHHQPHSPHLPHPPHHPHKQWNAKRNTGRILKQPTLKYYGYHSTFSTDKLRQTICSYDQSDVKAATNNEPEHAQDLDSDITMYELAGYFENLVNIPKQMSTMAEMMYS